jgi:mannose-6-phosphate isomerase-like protein (cupin superfamily)
VGVSMSNRFTIENALELVVASDDKAYGVLLRHGTMELGFYSPDGRDPQEPHSQDEIYIVMSGSGFFVNGDERRRFEAGEALFVAAGVEHRFEGFSDDIAAWVVFNGPQGGE